MPTKFAVCLKKIKRCRFSPKAVNGEIIATGEACPGKKPAPRGEN